MFAAELKIRLKFEWRWTTSPGFWAHHTMTSQNVTHSQRDDRSWQECFRKERIITWVLARGDRREWRWLINEITDPLTHVHRYLVIHSQQLPTKNLCSLTMYSVKKVLSYVYKYRWDNFRASHSVSILVWFSKILQNVIKSKAWYWFST